MATYLNHHIQINHVVSNIQTPTSMLANFKVQISRGKHNQVIALFDTGATCSCVLSNLLHELVHSTSSLKPVKFMPMKLKVQQADGQTSLQPMGIAIITIQLHQHVFTHPFIVCNKLHQQMLLGLDFAGLNEIGFDWGSETGQVYLRYKGKPIMLGTVNVGNISRTIAASYGIDSDAHLVNKVAIQPDKIFNIRNEPTDIDSTSNKSQFMEETKIMALNYKQQKVCKYHHHISLYFTHNWIKMLF